MKGIGKRVKSGSLGWGQMVGGVRVMWTAKEVGGTEGETPSSRVYSGCVTRSAQTA